MKAVLNSDLSQPDQENTRFRKGILKGLIVNPPNVEEITQAFSKSTKNIVQLPFYSQEKTGYCWLLATLSCISAFTCQKYHLPNIRFSKNYLIFFDKVEKVNWFLEHILSTLSKNENSRTIRHLLNHASSDRGQWQMAKNLILKYGLIPGEIMTDAEAAHSTRELNTCLGMLLRNDAAQLRILYKKKADISALRAEKERMFQEILSILYSCYGIPPKWIKCPNMIAGEQKRLMTPQRFYQDYIDFPFEQYISLYNDGESSEAQYYIDQILLDGNVIGGEINTFMHVTEDVFFAAIQQQIQENGYCWFGCDCGKFYFKNLHIYDDIPVNLSLFAPSLHEAISKSRINTYSIASLSHAVVLLQNAETGGQYWWQGVDSSMDLESVCGRCYFSSHWISKYGFQAVVKKKYLPYDSQHSICRVRMPWEFYHIEI